MASPRRDNPRASEWAVRPRRTVKSDDERDGLRVVAKTSRAPWHRQGEGPPDHATDTRCSCTVEFHRSKHLLCSAALLPRSRITQRAGWMRRRRRREGKSSRDRLSSEVGRERRVAPRHAARGGIACLAVRAVRMRRPCRDRRALRRFGSRDRSHAPRRHHAQGGEPDALKTLVRSRTGVRHERRAPQARAAERQPAIACGGRPRRLAHRQARESGEGRRSVRAGGRRARRPDLCPRLQPDLRDGGARRRASLRRHPVPRRDDGVRLAVAGETVRLRL